MRLGRAGVRSSLDHVINPFIFYALCVLGGAGVCLALPRRKFTPSLLGALTAALAGGLLLILMGVKAGAARPNVYFYVFSLIGLGGALRVITHPRPVYAALYFILTVLSTAGLFLILSAEFMAFALIIVYAGAILITYLFVIMLATQPPEEGEVEALASYDIAAREPVAATVVGFLLLAVLTTMLFRGTPELQPPGEPAVAKLSEMPRKIENVLRNHGILKEGGTFSVTERPFMGTPEGVAKTSYTTIMVENPGEAPKEVRPWPEELSVKNPEGLGFSLLRDHPGTIEIAGVILLMAMLGSVVLSRKQVQIDEDAKGRQAAALAAGGGAGPALGRAVGDAGIGGEA
jgi:NADH-quinone oxidoreductase subunit J